MGNLLPAPLNLNMADYIREPKCPAHSTGDGNFLILFLTFYINVLDIAI